MLRPWIQSEITFVQVFFQFELVSKHGECENIAVYELTSG